MKYSARLITGLSALTIFCSFMSPAEASSWVMDRSQKLQADGSTVISVQAGWKADASTGEAWMEISRTRVTKEWKFVADKYVREVPGLKFNTATNEIYYEWLNAWNGSSKWEKLVCAFQDFMPNGQAFYVNSDACPLRTFEYTLNGTDVFDSTIYFQLDIYTAEGASHRNIDCTALMGTPMWFENVSAEELVELCFLPTKSCPQGWQQESPLTYRQFGNEDGLKGASLCR